MLSFHNLTLGYERHPAVHHLDGTVAEGALLALLGPNGGGKSTLLKGIMGELRPLSGRIQLAGVERRRIAYLPQQRALDLGFPITVRDLVALGYLLWGLSLGALTLGGVAAGLAVALLAGAVARGGVLGEDASLAAFYLISLALGVLLISLKGSQVDLFHVLFGSVLALDNATLILIAGITSLTLLALALLFRPLVAECVDPAFLRAVSRTSAPVHFVFLALVVLNLVAGFQALGTLLAVGMAILPAAAARFWVRDIGALLALAVALAFLGSTLGLLGSYHLGLAAGPAIVLAIGALYLASLLAGPRGLILAWLLSRRHLTG